MEMTEEAYLAHYGILRKSGRYPWGSGPGSGTVAKRSKMFLDVVDQHRREGMSDTKIAEAYGMKRKELQELRTIARNEHKADQIRQIQRYVDRGWSNGAIAERMGLAGESTVRSLRAEATKEKLDVLKATTDMLRREVEEKGAIDVGTDVFRNVAISDNPASRIGISSTKFDTAVTALRAEGYKYHTVRVPQINQPGQFTTRKVLAKPDVVWRDLVMDPSKIKLITSRTEDGGHNFDPDVFLPPISVSSKRVAIRYAEDGGTKADGLIYVRPGAKNLDMGGNSFAQVRIAVDGTHYLKGMAVYKDDLPDGVDLVFNTNKSNTGSKKDAMKPLKDDPDLPFGSVIDRQIKGPDGKLTSAINLVNEQGKWDEWSKNLPSQFLSKQSVELAKRQLDVTYEDRRKEFEELSALTNPVVKRHLLGKFAEETDSASVHLKAARMPKQATKVLIPIESIKPDEVYAPAFENGTRLALVRFPHGGTFEIPQVTVNNKNREARKTLGTDIVDAIGIHHTVAERLSGADFDGDTVLAIPNNRQEIKSTPALGGLKDFDAKSQYKAYDGMKTVDGGYWNEKTKEVDYQGRRPDKGQMQRLMGDVSNLITDMTIKGANTEELARAVRHSMVVIDCEKHVLDYKSSAKDNSIPALKERYQGRKNAGAATLISRAKSPLRVDAFKPRPAAEGGPIDKETGALKFVPKGDTYTNKKGEVVTPKVEVKKLAWTDDAHTLSSKPEYVIERVYADHSNRLKALANASRKEYVTTKTKKSEPSAKQVYAEQRASLLAKLNTARKNAPLERQAQSIAQAKVAQKKAANPHLEKSDVKKIESRALAEARVRTGARKQRVDITPEEWRAIQAGAISNNHLESILRNTDIEKIREYATPRTKKLMTSTKTARAQAMLAQGFTQAEVAAQLGVSLSTLKASLSGE